MQVETPEENLLAAIERGIESGGGADTIRITHHNLVANSVVDANEFEDKLRDISERYGRAVRRTNGGFDVYRP